MQKVFPITLLAIVILCAVVPSAGVLQAAVLQADGGDRDASKQATSRTGSGQAKRSKSQTPRTKTGGRVSLTPGREAAAMTFARLHHPELAELLSKLKTKKRARQYDQAVRQLFQTSERLARTRERDSSRYELELEAWQLDSRIRLLAARMTMNSGSKLESELKQLVQARADVRLRQLSGERERLAERLQRIDLLIERISGDPEASALREMQRIKRSFAGKRPRKMKAAQPVVAPVPRRAKSPAT